MLLTNGTAQDDQLLSASSDIAEAVEIHESKVDANGVMQMTPQEFVAIPKGKSVEFKPGGLHIMFIGLKKDLNVGDEITVTLHFKNNEDITLTVPVKDAASMGGSGMDMGGGMETPKP
jgi:copper(I)-binding protein